MPVRSPLTSAMNTGTPMRDKRSVSTWSEIVLPVPVAPVMSPWRLAMRGQEGEFVVAVAGDDQRVGHEGSRKAGIPSVAIRSGGRAARRPAGRRRRRAPCRLSSGAVLAYNCAG